MQENYKSAAHTVHPLWPIVAFEGSDPTSTSNGNHFGIVQHLILYDVHTISHLISVERCRMSKTQTQIFDDFRWNDDSTLLIYIILKFIQNYECWVVVLFRFAARFRAVTFNCFRLQKLFEYAIYISHFMCIEMCSRAATRIDFYIDSLYHWNSIEI